MLTDKTDRLNEMSILCNELERELIETKRQMTKQSEESNNEIESFNKQIDSLQRDSTAQKEEIASKLVYIGQLEVKCRNHEESIDNWAQEKDNIEKELYSYMSRLSELQIHKETLENDFRKQIQDMDDKLKSNILMLEERDAQILSLNTKIIDDKEDFERRLQAELNQLKFIQENNDSEELRLIKSNYEDQISELNQHNQTVEAELKQQIDRLLAQVEEHERQANNFNEISQKLINAKNEEIDDLQTQININESDRINLIQNYKTETETLNEQIDSLREEINCLTKNINEITKSKDELEIEFNNQIETLKLQIEEIKTTNETQISKNDQLLNEIERLKADATTNLNEMGRLLSFKSKNDQLLNEIESLKVESNSNLNEMNRLRSEFEELLHHKNEEIATITDTREQEKLDFQKMIDKNLFILNEEKQRFEEIKTEFDDFKSIFFVFIFIFYKYLFKKKEDVHLNTTLFELIKVYLILKCF
jgi:chromosome segregation ATPase